MESVDSPKPCLHRYMLFVFRFVPFVPFVDNSLNPPSC